MNPWFMAYSNFEGMLAVAKPGAIIVTGRGNRYDSRFQEARALGAKVYTYWNVANCPENLKNPEDQAQYLIDGKPPPAWPWKAADGSNRTQGYNSYMLDLRPGSAWLRHCIPNTGDMVDKRKFDGLFLDTLGARTWSVTKTLADGTVQKGADWQTWTVEEQTAWCEGSINILRAIKEELERRGMSHIELVCNNIWDLPAGHPSDAFAQTGDQHCNGVCLENPAGSTPGAYHVNYAKRPFGRLPRRVLVIDTTDADTIEWSKCEGVTHVCSVEKAKGETYAKVTPPVVPYDGWPPGELEAENEELRKRVAELTAQNKALQTQLDAEKAKVSAQQKQLDSLNSRMAQIHSLSAPAASSVEGELYDDYSNQHQEPRC